MSKILKKISNVTLKGIFTAPINKEVLSFSLPLMFVAILQTFMHWMDILMLGYFTSTETVGLYHPAARTAGLLQAILLSFISIYAPLVSNLHAEGKRNELNHLYQQVTRWLITCSIPVVLILIIFPSKVMLLFGPEYMTSAGVLQVLVMAAFIQTALGAAGPTLGMSGFTKLVFRNSLGAFVLNLILNIVLIPKFGIIGAAWATLLSLSVIGIARVVEVQYLISIFPFTRLMYKPVLAGILGWIILIYIKPYIMNFHTLITLLIVGIVTLLLFSIVLWYLKLEPEDKEFLSGIGVLGKTIKSKI